MSNTSGLPNIHDDDDYESRSNIDDEDDDDLSDTELASELLHSEIQTRSRLVQNARKLDHLTRLLISPHLHHEARLLLSLEMGRLDTHYRYLLRNLGSSSNAKNDHDETMEDTKEAEWLGLTGLERERKFVVEYRECFASLLNDVEILVSDVTPIVTSPIPGASSTITVSRNARGSNSAGTTSGVGTGGRKNDSEKQVARGQSTMLANEKREGAIKWAH